MGGGARTDERLCDPVCELPPRLAPLGHHLRDLLHLLLRQREVEQVQPRRVPDLLGLPLLLRGRVPADALVDEGEQLVELLQALLVVQTAFQPFWPLGAVGESGPDGLGGALGGGALLLAALARAEQLAAVVKQRFVAASKKVIVIRVLLLFLQCCEMPLREHSLQNLPRTGRGGRTHLQARRAARAAQGDCARPGVRHICGGGSSSAGRGGGRACRAPFERRSLPADGRPESCSRRLPSGGRTNTAKL